MNESRRKGSNRKIVIVNRTIGLRIKLVLYRKAKNAVMLSTIVRTYRNLSLNSLFTNSNFIA
jgi:hypothetical protein